MANVKVPKKLIEVALPLDDINVAAAREKSIRHGHPSTLHLWWARRPLVAARAILFAQLVNDPGYEQGSGFKRGVNKEKAATERERLFNIIRDLVKWENINNENVLKQAREEILKSWRETCALNKDHPQAAELFNSEKLPAFYDPFAGGGAIPLEAQRLGLESYASDLNPVSVMINKSMIEIPSKFSGRPPINDDAKKRMDYSRSWMGFQGISDDVRFYGEWMRNEAFKRIGKFYPKVKITEEIVRERPDLKSMLDREFTVIAWLWARTVKSPNPAFSHVDVPLVASFWLSTKRGRSKVWVEPVVKGDRYDFIVRTSGAPKIEETVNRNGGLCILSGTPIDFKYIRSEAKEGRMGQRLMAIVLDGDKGREYVSPLQFHSDTALKIISPDVADTDLPKKALGFRVQEYGMTKWRHLFTSRQLTGLATLSDMIPLVISRVYDDAIKAGWKDEDGEAYSKALGTYLAFLVDQEANQSSTICGWNNINQQMIVTFSRQAIPMVWDYAECNIFSSSTGSFLNLLDRQAKGIEGLVPNGKGSVIQENASSQTLSRNKVVSTDPPYYDNIGYADLSDFFYVWMRRSLKNIYPDLFATLAVPKTEELIATPFRHNSKKDAEKFFLDGMSKVLSNLSASIHPAFPLTIYYAFKQSESKGSETDSTGWVTFLEAVINSGLELTGAWPVRTESANKLKASVNALASSIVLVCRRRDASAPTVSRRDFVRELNTVLPEALNDMTRGGEHSPVAPVDLSQAIIGPGMAVFSKYSAVLEADGKPMTVRTALQLINRFLAEDDFDHDTQFCLHWFETVGWGEGKFGEAEVLSKAKGTSVDGVREAGVISAGSGKVRLLKWNEYPADWNPENDFRLPVWEGLHHLIRALRTGGETAAAAILGKLGTRIEAVRQLAYRLYTLCERNGWAEDARAYNELIATWQAIEAVAPKTTEKQMDLF